MCEQPHLPKLCFSNSLIYHNMTFWFYYTTTYFEKKPQNHSAVARRRAYFAEKADTSKRPPHPFHSQASSFANLGSAWLLQGVSWPGVPDVIHHYPNLTELWAHRAKPLTFICRLQPHAQAHCINENKKTRKSRMGPRWANWFPKTDLVCKAAISYKNKSSLRARCEISHAVSFPGADFKLFKI